MAETWSDWGAPLPTKRKTLTSVPSWSIDAEGGMGKEAATPGGNVASAAAALQTHLEGSDAPDAARNQRWGVATAVWALLCTRVLVSVVPALSADRYPLLFLYYQPLFLVALMIWLWGIVVMVWSTWLCVTPSPLLVFQLPDVRVHLTHAQVFQAAALWSTLVLTNVTVFAWAASSNRDSLAAVLPPLAYLAVPVTLLLPADILYRRSRHFIAFTLLRCLLPFQTVSFADFFFADILTSLAKAVSDAERALCSMACAPSVLAAVTLTGDVCGSASMHIPMWLAWPYAVRLLQCLRQFYDTRDAMALVNALKYSTAFPVIVLSAMKYHVSPAQWFGFYHPLWLAVSLLNSLFSFAWDVRVDWDLLRCPARYPGLRDELLYTPHARRGLLLYYWAVVSNFMLRIAWTYKLSSHLRHNQMMSTAVAVLEMLRRTQWMFLRVEKQYLALVKQHRLAITYH